MGYLESSRASYSAENVFTPIGRAERAEANEVPSGNKSWRFEDDDPEKCVEACASGYLTLKLHDNLPFGLAIFDDRVGIGVCKQHSGQLRVFVDTDSLTVREWAEAVYETYESEAILMEEFTHRGFQKAMETRARTS